MRMQTSENWASVGKSRTVSDQSRAFGLLVVFCIGIILTKPTVPSFQQVLPSEQWFPPTRTKSDAPHAGSFKDTKSQMYWLLKTYPEAFLGNLSLQGTISEQLRASRSHGDGVESQLGSVLAVGEVSDLRNPSHPVSRPAVATAAGEAGHILRVSMVALEKWTWAESSFPIGAPQSQFHGTWSSDGSSISKIQFATKPRQYDPIRWLIAQRSTSTTIFQPEIRAKPTSGVARTAIMGDADVQHIALGPLVTLTKDATGGGDHSDFSVNVGSETDAAQIAIVDICGNWSVWFIDSQRNHHGGPGIYTAIPKTRGTCGLSPSSWPSNQLRPSENNYRIAWVCKSARVDDWERDSSPSETHGSVSRSLQTDYLTNHLESDPKYDGLLICDHTRVQVSDTEGSKVHSHLNFSRRHRADVLLEAQSIEGCPSHVLVLTTEKLYVLDTSSIKDQEARNPRILISCPHFRGQTKQTLKMSVVRLQSSAEWASSLVLVYSSHNSRVQLFHLTINSQDGSASFHHQVVQLPGFHTSLGELAGIASLHAVPLRRSASKGRHSPASEATGSPVDNNKLQLFQLFVLANDLNLASSIVAITFGSAQWPGWPKKSAKTAWDDTQWRTSLRKRGLREVEDVFVVPDAVEEDRQFSRQRRIRSFPNHNTIYLRLWLIKLMEEINVGFFGEYDFVSGVDNGVGPFDSIKDISEKRETHEHVALQPLLGFKDQWHALDLTRLDALWNRELERLKKSSDVQLYECGTFGPRLDVAALFERFSINWSSLMAAESLKPTQWRYMQLALERMAAEVYLSEKGVYMAPQSTLDLASRAMPREGNSQSTVDDLYEELQFSRAGSEMTLPTPSATPSSSRATSQVAESFETQEEDDTSDRECPAVTRLRMYLQSTRFTPPAKQGQSRVMSLWPEQRGSDPENYRYSRKGKGADGLEQAAKRRQEKDVERRRRRAERRAQLGIKLEGFGDSFSQAHVPDEVRSSPPPQLFAKSQGQYQGFGFGSQSQAQSQSQNFGPSQTMSQPIRGEFGTRTSVLRKKIKGKHKAKSGFK